MTTQTMNKFNSKVIEGRRDERLDEPTWHVIILRHTLTTDVVDGEVVSRVISDERIVETFSRNDEDRARADGIDRAGQLAREA